MNHESSFFSYDESNSMFWVGFDHTIFFSFEISFLENWKKGAVHK